MNLTTFFTKGFSILLGIVYLVSQSVLVYASEINSANRQAGFWKDRQTAIKTKKQVPDSSPTLAQLPATLSSSNSNHVLKNLPFPKSITPNSALPKTNKEWNTRTLAPPIQTLMESLPHQFGSVRNISLPPSMKNVVFHIQDIHMNTEAQNNIGAAIQSLVQKNQINFVALEAAFGPIDLTPFQTFHNQDIIHKVADYLFREHKITAPLHTALKSSLPSPPLIGIDDKEQYDANVEAVRTSFPLKEKYREFLKQEKKTLWMEKRTVSNKTLIDFDNKVHQYHTNKRSLGNHITFLSNYFSKLPKQTSLFLKALHIETTLNFNKVAAERSSLLSSLLRKLNSEQTSSLLQVSVHYRLGKIPHSDFYTYLKGICKRNKVPLKKYPAMKDYVRYVLLSDKINPARLLQEIRELEEKAYASLITNEKERKLIDRSRQLYLIGKLVDFALTKMEWKELKAVRGPQSGVRSKFSNHGLRTTDHGLPFEAFYRFAESRDQKMAENLINEMENREAKISILVTGGFHSHGINKILKEKGIGIINFVPKLTKVETEKGSSYLSVFAQEKSPLEDLFEGQKLFLGQPQTPDLMMEGPVVAATLDHTRADEALEELAPDRPLAARDNTTDENTKTIVIKNTETGIEVESVVTEDENGLHPQFRRLGTTLGSRASQITDRYITQIQHTWDRNPLSVILPVAYGSLSAGIILSLTFHLPQLTTVLVTAMAFVPLANVNFTPSPITHDQIVEQNITNFYREGEGFDWGLYIALMIHLRDLPDKALRATYIKRITDSFTQLHDAIPVRPQDASYPDHVRRAQRAFANTLIHIVRERVNDRFSFESAREELARFRQTGSKKQALVESVNNGFDAMGDPLGRLGKGALQNLAWLEEQEETLIYTSIAENDRRHRHSLVFRLGSDNNVRLDFARENLTRDHLEGTQVSTHKNNPIDPKELDPYLNKKLQYSRRGEVRPLWRRRPINELRDFEDLEGHPLTYRLGDEKVGMALSNDNHDLTVSDSGHGMGLDVLLFVLPVKDITNRRTNRELSAALAKGDVTADGQDLFWKPRKRRSDTSSDISLLVGGTEVETLSFEGTNLPETVVLDLPTAAHQEEDRTHIVLEKVAIHALTELMDQAIAAFERDPPKYAPLINALHLLSVELKKPARLKSRKKEDDMVFQLHTRLKKVLPNLDTTQCVLMPNVSANDLIQPEVFNGRAPVYLTSELFRFDPRTVGADLLSTEGKSVWSVPGLTRPYQRVGQMLLLNKELTDYHQDQAFEGHPSVILNSLLSVWPGYSTKPKPEAVLQARKERSAQKATEAESEQATPDEQKEDSRITTLLKSVPGPFQERFRPWLQVSRVLDTLSDSEVLNKITKMISLFEFLESSGLLGPNLSIDKMMQRSLEFGFPINFDHPRVVGNKIFFDNHLSHTPTALCFLNSSGEIVQIKGIDVPPFPTNQQQWHYTHVYEIEGQLFLDLLMKTGEIENEPIYARFAYHLTEEGDAIPITSPIEKGPLISNDILELGGEAYVMVQKAALDSDKESETYNLFKLENPTTAVSFGEISELNFVKKPEKVGDTFFGLIASGVDNLEWISFSRDGKILSRALLGRGIEVADDPLQVAGRYYLKTVSSQGSENIWKIHELSHQSPPKVLFGSTNQPDIQKAGDKIFISLVLEQKLFEVTKEGSLREVKYLPPFDSVSIVGSGKKRTYVVTHDRKTQNTLSAFDYVDGELKSTTIVQNIVVWGQSFINGGWLYIPYKTDHTSPYYTLEAFSLDGRAGQSLHISDRHLTHFETPSGFYLQSQVLEFLNKDSRPSKIHTILPEKGNLLLDRYTPFTLIGTLDPTTQHANLVASTDNQDKILLIEDLNVPNDTKVRVSPVGLISETPTDNYHLIPLDPLNLVRTGGALDFDSIEVDSDLDDKEKSQFTENLLLQTEKDLTWAANLLPFTNWAALERCQPSTRKVLFETAQEFQTDGRRTIGRFLSHWNQVERGDNYDVVLTHWLHYFEANAEQAESLLKALDRFDEWDILSSRTTAVEARGSNPLYQYLRGEIDIRDVHSAEAEGAQEPKPVIVSELNNVPFSAYMGLRSNSDLLQRKRILDTNGKMIGHHPVSFDEVAEALGEAKDVGYEGTNTILEGAAGSEVNLDWVREGAQNGINASLKAGKTPRVEFDMKAVSVPGGVDVYETVKDYGIGQDVFELLFENFPFERTSFQPGMDPSRGFNGKGWLKFLLGCNRVQITTGKPDENTHVFVELEKNSQDIWMVKRSQVRKGHFDGYVIERIHHRKGTFQSLQFELGAHAALIAAELQVAAGAVPGAELAFMGTPVSEDPEVLASVPWADGEAIEVIRTRSHQSRIRQAGYTVMGLEMDPEVIELLPPKWLTILREEGLSFNLPSSINSHDYSIVLNSNRSALAEKDDYIERLKKAVFYATAQTIMNLVLRENNRVVDIPYDVAYRSEHLTPIASKGENLATMLNETDYWEKIPYRRFTEVAQDPINLSLFYTHLEIPRSSDNSEPVSIELLRQNLHPAAREMEEGETDGPAMQKCKLFIEGFKGLQFRFNEVMSDKTSRHLATLVQEDDVSEAEDQSALSAEDIQNRRFLSQYISSLLSPILQKSTGQVDPYKVSFMRNPTKRLADMNPRRVWFNTNRDPVQTWLNKIGEIRAGNRSPNELFSLVWSAFRESLHEYRHSRDGTEHEDSPHDDAFVERMRDDHLVLIGERVSPEKILREMMASTQTGQDSLSGGASNFLELILRIRGFKPAQLVWTLVYVLFFEGVVIRAVLHNTGPPVWLGLSSGFLIFALLFLTLHLAARLILYRQGPISGLSVALGSLNDVFVLSIYSLLPPFFGAVPYATWMPILAHVGIDAAWMAWETRQPVSYRTRIRRAWDSNPLSVILPIGYGSLTAGIILSLTFNIPLLTTALVTIMAFMPLANVNFTPPPVTHEQIVEQNIAKFYREGEGFDWALYIALMIHIRDLPDKPLRAAYMKRIMDSFIRFHDAISLKPQDAEYPNQLHLAQRWFADELITIVRERVKDRFSFEPARVDLVRFRQSGSKLQALVESVNNGFDAMGVPLGRLGKGALQNLAWLDEEGETLTYTSVAENDRFHRNSLIFQLDPQDNVRLNFTRENFDQSQPKGTQVTTHQLEPIQYSDLDPHLNQKLQYSRRGPVGTSWRHDPINDLRGLEDPEGNPITYRLGKDPVDINLTNENRDLMVSDSGHGIDLDVLLFVLPVKDTTNRRTNKQLNTALRAADLSADGRELYWKPDRETKEGPLSGSLLVGGTEVETLNLEGTNLPETVIIDLPTASFQEEDRSHIVLDEITVKALTDLMDQAFTAFQRDPPKYAPLINALYEISKELMDPSRVRSEDEEADLVNQLRVRLTTALPNVDTAKCVLLPNVMAGDLIHGDFLKGRAPVYLTPALFEFDPSTIEGELLPSRGKSIWSVPGLKIAYVRVGQMLLLNKAWTNFYQEQAFEGRPSVMLNRLMDLWSGYSTKPPAEAELLPKETKTREPEEEAASDILSTWEGNRKDKIDAFINEVSPPFQRIIASWLRLCRTFDFLSIENLKNRTHKMAAVLAFNQRVGLGSLKTAGVQVLTAHPRMWKVEMNIKGNEKPSGFTYFHTNEELYYLTPTGEFGQVDGIRNPFQPEEKVTWTDLILFQFQGNIYARFTMPRSPVAGRTELGISISHITATGEALPITTPLEGWEHQNRILKEIDGEPYLGVQKIAGDRSSRLRPYHLFKLTSPTKAITIEGLRDRTILGDPFSLSDENYFMSPTSHGNLHLLTLSKEGTILSDHNLGIGIKPRREALLIGDHAYFRTAEQGESSESYYKITKGRPPEKVFQSDGLTEPYKAGDRLFIFDKGKENKLYEVHPEGKAIEIKSPVKIQDIHNFIPVGQEIYFEWTTIHGKNNLSPLPDADGNFDSADWFSDIESVSRSIFNENYTYLTIKHKASRANEVYAISHGDKLEFTKIAQDSNFLLQTPDGIYVGGDFPYTTNNSGLNLIKKGSHPLNQEKIIEDARITFLDQSGPLTIVGVDVLNFSGRKELYALTPEREKILLLDDFSFPPDTKFHLTPAGLVLISTNGELGIISIDPLSMMTEKGVRDFDSLKVDPDLTEKEKRQLVQNLLLQGEDNLDWAAPLLPFVPWAALERCNPETRKAIIRTAHGKQVQARRRIGHFMTLWNQQEQGTNFNTVLRRWHNFHERNFLRAEALLRALESRDNWNLLSSQTTETEAKKAPYLYRYLRGEIEIRAVPPSRKDFTPRLEAPIESLNNVPFSAFVGLRSNRDLLQRKQILDAGGKVIGHNPVSLNEVSEALGEAKEVGFEGTEAMLEAASGPDVSLDWVREGAQNGINASQKGGKPAKVEFDLKAVVVPNGVEVHESVRDYGVGQDNFEMFFENFPFERSNFKLGDDPSMAFNGKGWFKFLLGTDRVEITTGKENEKTHLFLELERRPDDRWWVKRCEVRNGRFDGYFIDRITHRKGTFQSVQGDLEIHAALIADELQVGAGAVPGAQLTFMGTPVSEDPEVLASVPWAKEEAVEIIRTTSHQSRVRHAGYNVHGLKSDRDVIKLLPPKWLQILHEEGLSINLPSSKKRHVYSIVLNSNRSGLAEKDPYIERLQKAVFTAVGQTIMRVVLKDNRRVVDIPYDVAFLSEHLTRKGTQGQKLAEKLNQPGQWEKVTHADLTEVAESPDNRSFFYTHLEIPRSEESREMVSLVMLRNKVQAAAQEINNGKKDGPENRNLSLFVEGFPGLQARASEALTDASFRKMATETRADDLSVPEIAATLSPTERENREFLATYISEIMTPLIRRLSGQTRAIFKVGYMTNKSSRLANMYPMGVTLNTNADKVKKWINDIGEVMRGNMPPENFYTSIWEIVDDMVHENRHARDGTNHIQSTHDDAFVERMREDQLMLIEDLVCPELIIKTLKSLHQAATQSSDGATGTLASNFLYLFLRMMGFDASPRMYLTLLFWVLPIETGGMILGFPLLGGMTQIAVFGGILLAHFLVRVFNPDVRARTVVWGSISDTVVFSAYLFFPWWLSDSFLGWLIPILLHLWIDSNWMAADIQAFQRNYRRIQFIESHWEQEWPSTTPTTMDSHLASTLRDKTRDLNRLAIEMGIKEDLETQIPREKTEPFHQALVDLSHVVVPDLDIERPNKGRIPVYELRNSIVRLFIALNQYRLLDSGVLLYFDPVGEAPFVVLDVTSYRISHHGDNTILQTVMDEDNLGKLTTSLATSRGLNHIFYSDSVRDVLIEEQMQWENLYDDAAKTNPALDGMISLMKKIPPEKRSEIIEKRIIVEEWDHISQASRLSFDEIPLREKLKKEMGTERQNVFFETLLERGFYYYQLHDLSESVIKKAMNEARSYLVSFLGSPSPLIQQVILFDFVSMALGWKQDPSKFDEHRWGAILFLSALSGSLLEKDSRAVHENHFVYLKSSLPLPIAKQIIELSPEKLWKKVRRTAGLPRKRAKSIRSSINELRDDTDVGAISSDFLGLNLRLAGFRPAQLLWTLLYVLLIEGVLIRLVLHNTGPPVWLGVSTGFLGFAALFVSSHLDARMKLFRQNQISLLTVLLGSINDVLVLSLYVFLPSFLGSVPYATWMPILVHVGIDAGWKAWEVRQERTKRVSPSLTPPLPTETDPIIREWGDAVIAGAKDFVQGRKEEVDVSALVLSVFSKNIGERFAEGSNEARYLEPGDMEQLVAYLEGNLTAAVVEGEITLFEAFEMAEALTQWMGHPIPVGELLSNKALKIVVKEGDAQTLKKLLTKYQDQLEKMNLTLLPVQGTDMAPFEALRSQIPEVNMRIHSEHPIKLYSHTNHIQRDSLELALNQFDPSDLQDSILVVSRNLKLVRFGVRIDPFSPLHNMPYVRLEDLISLDTVKLISVDLLLKFARRFRISA
ncbi:hypothetical protein BVX98_01165 [bacterium F11]|nr:hypothetical protein BVX98_01165 [bacterium F11]